MALYAATIFLGAFLLFQVQPVMGKWILPWFGGGPAVWTVCMLFFQAALLAGYAYAHGVRTRLGERGQAIVHLAILAVALVVLPIAPSASWKPEGGEDPTWRILLVLATSVGLPYLALAATSPLLQAWFSAAYPRRSPYRLFALSNAGSLLALASYPFLIEPALGLKTQAAIWSAGFVAFVALCAGCAIRAGWLKSAAASALGETTATRNSPPVGGQAVAVPPPAPPAAEYVRPGIMAHVLWLALPACGSVLLLAVTNQMCYDVGVVPDLWVLPLGLYLVSFILCFESDRVYLRPVFWVLLVPATAGVLWLLYKNVDAPILYQIVGYSVGLFAACMVCHGELARLKPSPRHLTSFYLTLAAGGAVGGVLVAVVAPLVFPAYYELHVGLWTCMVLALIAWLYERRTRGRRGPAWAFPLVAVSAVAAIVGAAVLLVQEAREQIKDAASVSRNFYGLLRVTEYGPEDTESCYHVLFHGRIMHGLQYEEEPLRSEPTTYFGPNSGVGLVLLNRRHDGPMRVGIVGLGTGTLAAYGRTGDTFRFYEINPAVRRLATSRFTYVADSAARCDVVLGDARLSLEREPPEEYDVLALDAFSGDAIPVHLLTEEAFQIYQRHLKPDGVLAVHTSNRFVDLEPVVLGLAAHFGLGAVVINDENKGGSEEFSESTWILLSRDRNFLDRGAIRSASAPPQSKSARRLWTDDYSNLFSILR